ncbi:MAG: multicopper oxidase domain-containing protein [Acidobacteriota bacterium]
MTSRRDFLKIGAMTGAGLLVPWKFGVRTAFAQTNGTPLPGSSIPRFVDPLPLLSVAGGPMETIIAGTSQIELTMREFQSNVMPSSFVPATGTYTGTWVWGYRAGITPYAPAGTYIGPVIVASRGTPTQVKYVNDLTANNIAWRDWTDQTLHWADPLNGEANACALASNGPASAACSLHYSGPVPAVTHLHGGEVPPVVDGGPDSWFTSDGVYHGHAFYTGDGSSGNYAVYRYLNTQEAGPLWFHDHALGVTRLNVYAGLAGAYVLTDPELTLPTGLNPVGLQQGNDDSTVDYLIPLVLQDRAFDTNGQLYFPNAGINPEHPYWIPELVGDTIVINGKVWPFLNVEPRRYRFLLINGSNARTYELFLVNPVTKAMGPPIWQIETDGGYLDTPVKIDPAVKPLNKLRIMPGERAGFIIDFAGFAGQTLLIRNTGKTPYPKGESPHGSTLGQILQFRVGATSSYTPDASYDPASGVALRTPIIRLVNPTAGTLASGVNPNVRRQLTLNEVLGAGGPLEVLLNNTKWDGTRADGTHNSDFTPVTTGGITEYFSELPNEGDTELWEIVNLTADAHPIHTHLTQFQLMNRQNFNMNKYVLAYNAAFPNGAYIAAYGPPKAYNFYASTPPPGILGGNPDVTPYLQGPVRPPDANEAGWKDTVMAPPGMVTRFIVRYAPTDASSNLYYPFDPDAEGHGYVWHCHIIDHEDNEMMRPLKVNPSSGASRLYCEGPDY